MKKRLAIAIVLALILLVTLATPVLAGKAAARGRLMPFDETTQGMGRYVFYTATDIQGDIDSFTLSISVMKLLPNTYYNIGYVVTQTSPFLNFKHNEYVDTDSRGRIKYTFEPCEDVFNSTGSFGVYVDLYDDTAPWDLSSGPLQLFP